MELHEFIIQKCSFISFLSVLFIIRMMTQLVKVKTNRYWDEMDIKCNTECNFLPVVVCWIIHTALPQISQYLTRLRRIKKKKNKTFFLKAWVTPPSCINLSLCCFGHKLTRSATSQKQTWSFEDWRLQSRHYQQR